jgi:nitroimidazol reductase NimA-like FMN-containing flavoprotein (pyridoxamine 5'-phosphate oxidase superfamily)
MSAAQEIVTMRICADDDVRDLRPCRTGAAERHHRRMEFDRNGLQVLEHDECMQLLASATLGRLAVSAGALPSIVPVNFLLDGDRILIRTSPGTKLLAALEHAVVAFEVDDFDSFSHSGWSVSVTGMADEVRDSSELERIERLPLPHWSGAGSHVIAITTELVSGRRIPPEHAVVSTR